MQTMENQSNEPLLDLNQRLSNEIPIYGIKEELRMRKVLDPLVDYIIIKKGRAGIWEVVDAIMKFMVKYHRAELKEILESIKKERELMTDDFGATKSKSFRKLGSIPERVEVLLRRAYEDEFPIPHRDFKRQFFKRYPGFAVARKI